MRRSIYNACLNGDIEKIDLLLKKGFPVNSSINNDGDTLLHNAAAFEDKKMIDLLLENGASLVVHNKHGYRPIDYPYSNSLTNICKSLELKLTNQNNIINGIPEPVLDGVFKFYDIIRDHNLKTHLFIDGAPPDSEILSWIRARDFKLLEVDDYYYLIKQDQYTAEKKWVDRCGNQIILCEIKFTKKNIKRYEWDLFIRFAPEPSQIGVLAQANIMVKEYGYWFIK